MRPLALVSLLLAACSGPGARAPRGPAPGDSAAPLPPAPTVAPAASSAPPVASVELTPLVGDPFASSPACSEDAACGWARCNKRVGRCAFPCVSDAECSEEARCLPAPGNPEVRACAVPLDL